MLTDMIDTGSTRAQPRRHKLLNLRDGSVLFSFHRLSYITAHLLGTGVFEAHMARTGIIRRHLVLTYFLLGIAIFQSSSPYCPNYSHRKGKEKVFGLDRKG
jgi:hypothetical protein